MSKLYYPPLEVYKNIYHLLQNRNLELVFGSMIAGSSKTKSSKNYLSDDDFIKNIQFDKFIIIEAKDTVSKTRRYRKTVHSSCHNKPTRTFIIILDRQTEAIKSPYLQKILMKLSDIKSTTRKFNMDVILITENTLTNHPIKKLQEFQTNGSDDIGYIHFTHKIYTLFIMNIFDHVSVPKHKILSHQDAEKVIKQLSIKKTQLPKITQLDSVSVFLGAIPDDIIEIETFNENSGLERRYRLVI